MKLYNFEKYYISLVRYKAIMFLKKMVSILEKAWSNSLGRFLLTAIWFLTSVMIIGFLITYFFIGVNAFLEKFHLEKYRIEEINFMSSKLDLKEFYKK